MFTVMIQLGSILAIMWLYRAKIIDVVSGLPSRPRRGGSRSRLSSRRFRRWWPARSFPTSSRACCTKVPRSSRRVHRSAAW